MTLQGCPGGYGFCDFESVNARKTIVCTLYSQEKRLPKTAPGSQGAAPGAANVWRLPTALPGWRLPGNDSRLPEAVLEPLMCRAVISASLVASCVWICLVRLPGAAPEAANAWRLPEPSQSCSSRNMTPGGGPKSPGVVPPTSLVDAGF